jgi:hypothetical protein
MTQRNTERLRRPPPPVPQKWINLWMLSGGVWAIGVGAVVTAARAVPPLGPYVLGVAAVMAVGLWSMRRIVPRWEHVVHVGAMGLLAVASLILVPLHIHSWALMLGALAAECALVPVELLLATRRVKAAPPDLRGGDGAMAGVIFALIGGVIGLIVAAVMWVVAGLVHPGAGQFVLAGVTVLSGAMVVLVRFLAARSERSGDSGSSTPQS